MRIESLGGFSVQKDGSNFKEDHVTELIYSQLGIEQNHDDQIAASQGVHNLMDETKSSK